MLPTIYSPKDRWRVREMFGLWVISEMAKRAQWPPLVPRKVGQPRSAEFEAPLNAAFAAMSLEGPYVVPFGLSVSERAMAQQQFLKRPQTPCVRRRKMRQLPGAPEWRSIVRNRAVRLAI